MAYFFRMLNRLIGKPTNVNDEVINETTYINQQQKTSLESSILIFEINDLEKDINFIYKQYENCQNDGLRRRILFEMFLEKTNILTQKKKTRDINNSKLVKNVYRNVTDPENINSGKKNHTPIRKVQRRLY